MKNKLFFCIFFISNLIFSQTEIELNNKGIEEAKNNRLEMAIYYFNQSIQENPNYAKAYSNRGKVNA